MMTMTRGKRALCLLLAGLLLAIGLSACAPAAKPEAQPGATEEPDTAGFLVAVEDEPDTVDFQCTTIYYTVATNVFNRLVEMVPAADGSSVIRPSLAESWEVTEHGRRYTFRLRENVSFSNGSPLTSSDVLYTLKRLLTHPESCNRDIAEVIEGALELERGQTQELAGFEILSDRDFAVTLVKPFSAFLACLSMPGASILDEESTRAAGDRFGKDPACTIGTGSYILKEWEPRKGMVLTANDSCWEGPPANRGLRWLFMTEQEDVRRMFDAGELDILDLDDLNSSAEFYFHGDIYQERLHAVRRIAITYVALNESVKPLNDVRVRKALQLGLHREVLLNAVYSGRGSVTDGIFPPGLYGHNPELPEIPYDPDGAKALLAEAGYPDGFELSISVRSSSTQGDMTLSTLIASMWEKIGVHTTVNVMDESEFMRLRKSGALACYAAMWTADYNDPDNFLYPFFGSRENTVYRSLCYPRQEIMDRVQNARTIEDPDERIREYQELERIIAQEDAAWIPLFTRLHYYVEGERFGGFTTSWNGSVKNNYRSFFIKD